MSSTIEFIAERSANLDTVCFRGFAPLAQLARISQADVYDQESNPNGLQRDLSKKHAAEAYEYLARDADKKLPRAFPEVVLNVRDEAVVKVADLPETKNLPVHLVKVTFDADALAAAKSVKVSRVDGNHRLFFAAGDGDNRPAIDLLAPFQLHVGLSRQQEANLFADINANQKGMNTSHLAVLRARLTDEQVELIQRPQRVYAMRLVDDEASPFKGMIHMGGSKSGSKKKGITHTLTFVALENAVKRLLNRSQHLQEMASSDAQYALIRAYWQAVASTWLEAFENPGDYLLTKGIGVNVLAQLGGTVIDRSLVTNSVDTRDMADLLAHTKDALNWAKDAPHGEGVGGMSGNKAVLLLAGQMADRLPKLAKS